MSNKYFLVFLAFLFSVSVYSQHGRHRNSLISGRVMSTEKEVVDFATVYLKGTNQGCYTDEKGLSCNSWGIKFSQFPSCIYLC